MRPQSAPLTRNIHVNAMDDVNEWWRAESKKIQESIKPQQKGPKQLSQEEIEAVCMDLSNTLTQPTQKSRKLEAWSFSAAAVVQRSGSRMHAGNRRHLLAAMYRTSRKTEAAELEAAVCYY